jgi:hypothetical protein
MIIIQVIGGTDIFHIINSYYKIIKYNMIFKTFSLLFHSLVQLFHSLVQPFLKVDLDIEGNCVTG